MLKGMDTCPVCRMNVLPTPQGLCPSCRSYGFEKRTTIAGAQIRREPTPGEIRENLFQAALQYRRYLYLLGGHFLSLLLLVSARDVLGLPSSVATTVEYAAGAALLVVDVAILVLVTRLVARLEMGVPFFWVMGILIPYVGTLVLLAFMRAVARAFKGRGVPLGPFGPDPEALRHGVSLGAV